MTPRLPSLGAAAGALVLAGCQALNAPPPVDIAQPTSVRPLPVVAPVVNNGAIFQAGQYRPLFEDYRARLVGDTLTVQIVERVSASQKSNSSVDKNGKIDASITALPYIKAGALTRAQAAASSDNAFEGKGSTDSTAGSSTSHGRICCSIMLKRARSTFQ